MLENIKLAFQGIWSHKMRSILTMLGIIIGIASIITIVSTITGTSEQIKENLIGAGNNTVTVQLHRDGYPLQLDYEQAPDTVQPLSEEFRVSLLDEESIKSASLFRMRESYDAIYNGGTLLEGGRLYGIDAHYLDTLGFQVKRGRGFGSDDYEGGKKIALLDGNAAKTLFLTDDPIGKTIEIKGEPYIVVGIVEQGVEFEPVINTIEDYYQFMVRGSGQVFIPADTWPIVYRYDEPHSVVVRANTTEEMTIAGKVTADLINADMALEEGNILYMGEDLLKEVQGLQEISQSTNMQLLWIASISLLVGGIGVMNIMLVSVTERTKEIGLKKALGAEKKHILIQFLTEAAVLTSLGGIFGIGSGIALSFVISRVSQIPVAISLPAILIAVFFSMIIGILFGLLPAIKASKLNPIEALQFE